MPSNGVPEADARRSHLRPTSKAPGGRSLPLLVLSLLLSFTVGEAPSKWNSSLSLFPSLSRRRGCSTVQRDYAFLRRPKSIPGAFRCGDNVLLPGEESRRCSCCSLLFLLLLFVGISLPPSLCPRMFHPCREKARNSRLILERFAASEISCDWVLFFWTMKLKGDIEKLLIRSSLDLEKKLRQFFESEIFWSTNIRNVSDDFSKYFRNCL